MRRLYVLIAIKLLVHLLTNTGYGIHRDELLYVALSRHLDLGYIEVPPLLPLVVALQRVLLGDSLFALRLFPAFIGTLTLALTVLMVREMRGSPRAEITAGIAMLVAPIFLRGHLFLQPVVYDQFFWTLGCYLLLRIMNGGSSRLWIAFGVACGLGLANKYSMLFFGVGVLAGLLLTSARKVLRTPGPWIAAAIALAFALPNLIWQNMHGWPFLTHMQRLSESQLVYVDRVSFLVDQILIMHPITLPVWIGGLIYFFSKRGKPYRLFGWMYLTVLLILLVARGKSYYLGPAYPVLVAGGAVALEHAFERRWQTLRMAYPVLMVISGIALAPVSLPILPPAMLERYLRALGLLEATNRTETRRIERLPQDFADMHGWKEQAALVARAYHTLSGPEKTVAVVAADNYGEAGAIDYFGPAYGLPRAVSTDSSYRLWGPGNTPGDVAVTLGIDLEDLQQFYRDCRLYANFQHEWAIWYENGNPVYICRERTRDLREAWVETQP